jgi:hypothetical protein
VTRLRTLEDGMVPGNRFPFQLSSLPGKLVYSADNRLLGQVAAVVQGNNGRVYLRILVRDELGIRSDRVLMRLANLSVTGDMIRLNMSLSAFVRLATRA